MEGEGEIPGLKPGSGCADGRERAGRLFGRVVSSRPLGSLVRLTLEVPGFPRARAGQFVLLQPEPSRCFLARPLSICHQEHHSLTFLVAPIGEGTRELCALGPGAAVWVLGPLGNGFDVDLLLHSGRRTVVVAGGVGTAPFPSLLSAMADRVRGSEGAPAARRAGAPPSRPDVLLLLGFRDSAQSRGAQVVTEMVQRIAALGPACEVEVIAEDGSLGPAGRATDLLERRLEPGDQVVACGPWAMSQAVWRVCAEVEGVDSWFSLETMMACGVGSCHGCVITLADGSYARVCHEGPVFSGREVFGG